MNEEKEIVFNNKKLTSQLIQLQKGYEQVVGYLQQNNLAREELDTLSVTFNETRGLVQQIAQEAVNTSIYHQSHNEALAEYLLDVVGIEQEEYLQKVEDRIVAHKSRFAEQQKEALKASSPQMKKFIERSDALVEERFTSKGLTPTEEDIQLINKEVMVEMQNAAAEEAVEAEETVTVDEDVEVEETVVVED